MQPLCSRESGHAGADYCNGLGCHPEERSDEGSAEDVIPSEARNLLLGCVIPSRVPAKRA
jgi:hypothetical protein